MYGYGGGDVADLVWWWHRALGFADVHTLNHFVGYRGFELTASAIQREGQKRDIARIAGSMRRRPTNTDRFVGGSSSSSARPRQPTRPERWKLGFGIEISADTLGKFKPQAYGNISTAVLFVDPGHDPPMAFLVEGQPGVIKKNKRSTEEADATMVAKALRKVITQYELQGHRKSDGDSPTFKRTTLRADMGGEFISEQMADACSGLKVKQIWSTPHCHEQNGVAEAYIQELFALVTACYAAAAWAPRHLWMYCIKYCIMCMNLRVNPLTDTCPVESFYNSRWSFRARPSMPFACALLIFVPKHLRTWKFGEHGIPALYLGSPDGVKEGIYAYVLMTGRVRIAREFVILETIPHEWPRYNGMLWKTAHNDGDVMPAPDHNRFVEDDLKELLEEAGELEMAANLVDQDEGTIEEVEAVDLDSEEQVETTSVSTTDGATIEEVIAVDPELEGTQLVPTVHIPREVEDGFFLSRRSDDSGLSSHSSWWGSPVVSTPVGPPTTGAGAGKIAAAADASGRSVMTAVAPTPSRRGALVQPPAPRRVVSTEAGHSDSVGTGLLPADAGAVLPPRPGTKLDFGRLKPLITECPDLAYVMINSVESTGAARNPKSAGRRRPIRATAHVRACMMVEKAAREREERRQMKIHFQEVAKSKHRAVKQPKKYTKKKRNSDTLSVAAALRGPFRDRVRAAMDLELTSYIDTFQAIEVLTPEEIAAMTPEERKRAITSHFEIELKRDELTWEVARVKARLVIHGNQTDKYSYEAIASPTARPAAVKLLLSILAKRTVKGKRFKARSWDVKSAFLQNKIQERLAARAAKTGGRVAPQQERILLRLPDGRITELKSYAYGLKQASYEWYRWVADTLTAAGFVETSDPCIYKLWEGDDVIILTVHVDDILAISTSDALHDKLEATLQAEFAGPERPLTRHMGPELTYLKMRIRQAEDGSVTVDQSQYLAERVVKDWGHGKGPNTKPEWRLIDDDDEGVTDHPLQATYNPHEDDEVAVDATWYRGVIGAINYAAGMSRPDLLYAMSVLAEHCNNPTRLHRRMLKRVMRYIRGTLDVGLHYKCDEDWNLTCWADASFATRTGARSQTGYCFALGEQNATFYAKSQKQSLVTLSSTEAEYVALFHAATEVVYLRRLLDSMGFGQEDPTVIFQDNQSTILWAHGQRQHQRTKHIDVKYHYIQDLIQDGVVELDFLPTDQMTADLLTKALLAARFQGPASLMLGLV